MVIRSRSSVAVLAMPQLGLMSEQFEKVVEKIIWFSTILLLRTTKNVISQPHVKIKKRSLAHFSSRFTSFPHAFTS